MNAKQLDDIPSGSGRTDFDYSYHFITRTKRTGHWIQYAWARCTGDCCLAVAEEYFAAHGFTPQTYTLERLVDGNQWHAMQVRQHLRSVGIK